jgi:hypothetical protein
MLARAVNVTLSLGIINSEFTVSSSPIYGWRDQEVVSAHGVDSSG